MMKSVSILLLTIILLQSCVVYQNTPVSVTEAYYMRGPIKAVTKEGNIVKLSDIMIMQGEYYGITLRGNLLFPLTSVETTYFIKDIKKSRIRTFMFYAVLYTACALLGVLVIFELIDLFD